MPKKFKIESFVMFRLTKKNIQQNYDFITTLYNGIMIILCCEVWKWMHYEIMISLYILFNRIPKTTIFFIVQLGLLHQHLASSRQWPKHVPNILVWEQYSLPPLLRQEVLFMSTLYVFRISMNQPKNETLQ